MKSLQKILFFTSFNNTVVVVHPITKLKIIYCWLFLTHSLSYCRIKKPNVCCVIITSVVLMVNEKVKILLGRSVVQWITFITRSLRWQFLYNVKYFLYTHKGSLTYTYIFNNKFNWSLKLHKMKFYETSLLQSAK